MAAVLNPTQDDGSLVSVFEFNGQQRRNLLPVAQNAVRRLRVTRHPDILKFMDAVEADGTVYIMTERVKSLSTELSSWETKPANERQDWLLWGLHRITVRTPVPESSPWTDGNSYAPLPLRITYLFLECSFIHPLLMQRSPWYCSHRLYLPLCQWRMEARRFRTVQ